MSWRRTPEPEEPRHSFALDAEAHLLWRLTYWSLVTWVASFVVGIGLLIWS